jgi:hypothetical protein
VVEMGDGKIKIRVAIVNFNILVQIHIAQNKWSVTFLTMEVGARGFVSHSFVSTLLRLGISRAIYQPFPKNNLFDSCQMFFFHFEVCKFKRMGSQFTSTVYFRLLDAFIGFIDILYP